MRITAIVFCAAFCAASFASAADLVLPDGRIFRNYTYLRQTGHSITVRYDAGIATIRKADLPEPVRRQYPIDVEIDRGEQQRRDASIALQAKYAAAHRARVAEVAQAGGGQTVARPSVVPAQAGPADSGLEDFIAERAERHALDYFDTHHPAHDKNYLNIESKVVIDEVARVEGWPGRWRCRGHAAQNIYRSRSSFSTVTRRFSILIFDDGKSRRYEMESVDTQ
jgi:hypothetical protein